MADATSEQGVEGGGGPLGPEEVRINRLESLVRSLQMENKRLLTRVEANKPTGAAPGGGVRRADSGPHQELINLAQEGEGEKGVQDMWLYVSPVRPPTPEQRLVSPQQWLVERAEPEVDGNIPSLNEVRVALFTQESSARNMFESQSAGKGRVKRTLSAKSMTAQKFLDDVRHRRRNSLPDTHVPDVAVPSKEESSSAKYELASGGGVRITPKWSSEERPRNVPIKPVLPLGVSPVVGVDARRSPNTVGSMMTDIDNYSGGLGSSGSSTLAEPDSAQPLPTATEVDAEHTAVFHGTDYIHRSPLPRRKVPGSPKPRYRVVDPEQAHRRAVDPEQAHHRAVDPEQAHHRAVDPEQAHHRAVDPEQAHHRAVDPEQAHHRAVDPEQAHHRAVDPEQVHRRAVDPEQAHRRAVDPDEIHGRVLDVEQYQLRAVDPDQAHRRSPLAQRKTIGSPKLQPNAVDPDKNQCRPMDPDQIQNRTINSDEVHHRGMNPDHVRAVNPDQTRRRSPLAQRKAIGSPKLQLRAVDPDHVQQRAVDPDHVQHSSLDPDQMECRAVDPDQLNHRSPLRQRMVIGSPRLQHRKLDLDQHQHRAVDQHPQIAVAPDQLHHKALEPDQLQHRKVIGSPKLQRRAVDSDRVKPVGVDPDHVQLRAVDPSQMPRRAVDPDHVQLRAVDPSQSPRRWVDASQTHVRAADPDHVHPKAESLAKTSKYPTTRRLPDAAHWQRPGQVGVPSSSPAAVGQVPEQHTSALSVSSSGVTRTKRVRDGLNQKRSPARGRGGAYTSPSANGPSSKAPQRRSAGPQTAVQDTGWMDGCF